MVLRPLFFRNRSGNLLPVITIVVIGIALLIPYLPFYSLLGCVPLMLLMIEPTVLYVVVTELAKRYFYVRAENKRFLGVGKT